MHSRKARVNDGYYENQNRSFQSSKYNNNRYSNYYNRDRDASPKRIAHRSPSPEGSPRDSRDRYHQSSNSYRNKDRDRDYKKEKYLDKRGRDREIEYKSYSKKAKTRDRSSSDEDHKESDRLYEKTKHTDRDHNALRRTAEKERRFGDWKEMISKNNGKKYYYNERNQNSQWEKPDEWVDYEMSKEYPSQRGYRENKERDRKSRDDGRYNRNRNYKEPDDRYSGNKHSRANSRWPHDSYPATSSSGHHKGRHEDNADMDISPDDSTPTSEPSYASPTASSNQHPNNSTSNNNNSNLMNHDDDVMASPNNGHAKHPNSSTSLHHQLSNASSSSILSSLSKLNTGVAVNSTNIKNSTATSSSSPSTHNYSSYSSHHHHRHRSTSPNDLNSISGGAGDMLTSVSNSLHHNSNSLRNSPTNNNSSVSRLELNNSNSNHLIGDGPPTPEMDLNSGSEHRRLDGTTPGVSSLQSVMAASQTSNRLNLLTPSLAKFFRPDLITHVTNWPAEILEKQAQKCAEEAYLLGDLELSKISAEIQCARSIVRVAEIAATVQAQRRLFLQDQIKSLDESQTQNSSTISY